MSAVIERAAVPAAGNGARLAYHAFADGLRFPDPLTVSEWADRHRILPRKGAAEPGRWRTSRTPPLREIMDCLSTDHPARVVVFIKSTQVGGTEVGLNWVGYQIDHSPGPGMVVQPNIQPMAERWSKQRLAPMIEDTPALAAKVKPARARDSGNTTLLKEYAGGVLVVAGANSAASLRSMPVRDLFLDEIDAYPDDLDEEGSPIELAERRQSTFVRRKTFKCSTPTIKGASAIEAAYEESDQREFHVPCPYCRKRQTLVIENLTADGKYLCAQCGKLIAEHEKSGMLTGGRWVAKFKDRPIRGYHINALYAPVGLGYTWLEIAEMRERAKGDPIAEKTFTNTILGLPYESELGKIDVDELAERREDWHQREIPPGCLIITAGIDVQADRWAVKLLGFGPRRTGDAGHDIFFIDRVDIPGDPTDPESWKALDDYLWRPLRNSYGIEMRPRLVAIDSGNWTHEVYNWARARQSRGVIAIKGASIAGKPIISRGTPQDVNIRGRTIKAGVLLYPIGTDTAKQSIVGWLQTDATKAAEARRVRIPSDYAESHLEELVGERFDPEKNRWVKVRGRRNEDLDVTVYAYAAACHPLLRLHLYRESDWQRIADVVEPKQADLLASSPASNKPEKKETDPPAQRAPARPVAKKRRRGGGYINKHKF